MQEVEVPAKGFLRYTYTIESVPCTLVWWFNTRRKNISFGLFRTNSIIPGGNVRTSSELPDSTSLHSSTSPTEAKTTTVPNQSYNEIPPPLPPKPESSSSPTNTTSSSSFPSRLKKTSIRPARSDSLTDETPPTAPLTISTAKKAKGITNIKNAVSTSLTIRKLSVGELLSKPSSQAVQQSHVLRLVGSSRNTLRNVEDLEGKPDVVPELITLMPIQHYESAKLTIRGNIKVTEPGTFVFIFEYPDDSNTPSSPTTSLSAPGTLMVNPETTQPEYMGWILKKKKLKMQGWAKRWFMLYPGGVLSYKKTPDAPRRGQLELGESTVSVNPQRNLIVIDSGAELYQLRAISAEDFHDWLRAFRQYKVISDWRQFPSDWEQPGSEQAQLQDEEDTGSISGIETSQNYNILEELERLEQILANKTEFNELKVGLNRIKQQYLLLDSQHQANCETYETRLQQLQQENADLLEQLRRFIQPDASSFVASPTDTSTNMETTTTSVGTSGGAHSKRNSTLNRYISPASTRLLHQRTDSTGSILTAEFFDAADDILLAEELSTDDGESATIEEEEEEESITPIETSQMPANHRFSIISVHESSKLSLIPQSLAFYQYRAKLPAPMCREEVSLLSLLRKNVGKDLSSIAMPVSLNEPLNVLQRMCEALEYQDLLIKAAECDDPFDRLQYVCAFSISMLASTQHRAAKKPFNPLLGETYECVRPDKGFRFIAEKVCHNPPIMACHAESEWYEYFEESRPKSKFWGKSMELSTVGVTHVKLRLQATEAKEVEYYTFQKPTTWVRNMIAGTRYLEHSGEIRVVNHTTGDYGIIRFKESTMFSASRNEFTVALHAHGTNHNHRPLRTLSGRWSELIVRDVGDDRYEVIWRAPQLENNQYYGFTPFAMELNELPADLEEYLPRTDTRWRPDQRMYEHGRVMEADQEKLRLEERQRRTRQLMQEKGQEWEPRWFHIVERDPISEEAKCWRYKGGYWETRAKKQFQDLIELW